MYEQVWNVTKYAIRQYATATENLDPVYLNVADAKEAGETTMIAPTSYLSQYQMYRDPTALVETGGMHTKQKMSYYLPIHEGDSITGKTIASEDVDAKGRKLVIYTTQFFNQRNELVCEGVMTNTIVPSAK